MQEPTTFDTFMATRSPHLLRMAYLLTGDWDRAEDLLQTALARAWLAWARICGDPEPYLRKIILNTYVSWWRRRWNGERPTGTLPEAPDPDRYATVDDRDALWRAVRRLPKRQRAVIVLRFFEDLPEADVAEILGCSVGTVKSQGSKALRALRVDPSVRTEGVPL